MHKKPFVALKHFTTRAKYDTANNRFEIETGDPRIYDMRHMSDSSREKFMNNFSREYEQVLRGTGGNIIERQIAVFENGSQPTVYDIKYDDMKFTSTKKKDIRKRYNLEETERTHHQKDVLAVTYGKIDKDDDEKKKNKRVDVVLHLCSWRECPNRETVSKRFRECVRCLSLYCSKECQLLDHAEGEPFRDVCKNYQRRSNSNIDEIFNYMSGVGSLARGASSNIIVEQNSAKNIRKVLTDSEMAQLIGKTIQNIENRKNEKIKKKEKKTKRKTKREQKEM
jgi:hypothetical protein